MKTLFSCATFSESTSVSCLCFILSARSE